MYSPSSFNQPALFIFRNSILARCFKKLKFNHIHFGESIFSVLVCLLDKAVIMQTTKCSRYKCILVTRYHISSGISLCITLGGLTGINCFATFPHSGEHTGGGNISKCNKTFIGWKPGCFAVSDREACKG